MKNHHEIKKNNYLGDNVMSPYRSQEADMAISIGFKSLDIERPLGEVACRTGFGIKPASWLIDFIKHIGGIVTGTTVFALLGTCIELLIPEAQQTPELIELIYLTRQINEEPTDDAMELVSEEFVLDGFGIDDRQALETEIKEHKQVHARWTAFKGEFRVWKVALIISEYCFGWGGVGCGIQIPNKKCKAKRGMLKNLELGKTILWKMSGDRTGFVSI